ncbi:hypothetical protein ARMGADRAFT_1071475 [Armillaria gallica]|uniref:Uncharacterized protein n=1 Tax=Armillaria gallica TaxID=47427 RepID=A0A2H3E3E7_ARMGA|nr:hypothetical protein ARMGADRAFT_1071475 [Armillaria gallica]
MHPSASAEPSHRPPRPPSSASRRQVYRHDFQPVQAPSFHVLLRARLFGPILVSHRDYNHDLLVRTISVLPSYARILYEESLAMQIRTNSGNKSRMQRAR